MAERLSFQNLPERELETKRFTELLALIRDTIAVWSSSLRQGEELGQCQPVSMRACNCDNGDSLSASISSAAARAHDRYWKKQQGVQN